jgi:hypothetical protein
MSPNLEADLARDEAFCPPSRTTLRPRGLKVFQNRDFTRARTNGAGMRAAKRALIARMRALGESYTTTT